MYRRGLLTVRNRAFNVWPGQEIQASIAFAPTGNPGTSLGKRKHADYALCVWLIRAFRPAHPPARCLGTLDAGFSKNRKLNASHWGYLLKLLSFVSL